MDHEPNPYRDPASTGPGTGPHPGPAVTGRWKVPRVALTAGLAAFLAMTGAGVAFAVGGSGGASTPAAGSGSTSSSGSGSAPATPGPAGHGPRGGWGMMGAGPTGPGMGGVLHGVFTTRNGTNGFKTVQVQVGSVQPGNSTTSITVNSADGFSVTYAVQSSTVVNSQAGGISSVQSGDNVRVEAVQQGKNWTATDIVDTTRIGASRQGFGFARPAPPSTGSAQPGSSA